MAIVPDFLHYCEECGHPITLFSESGSPDPDTHEDRTLFFYNCSDCGHHFSVAIKPGFEHTLVDYFDEK